MVEGQQGVPRPQLIRYNDWRQVVVPELGTFTPVLPVSVIVPYYAAPGALALTLAALEGQTYPRDLFEVVVVDDGSPEPLERPRSTPLDVKVVRQEDRGFGLARARNTGKRAAAHDVLVFLDGDMLPEADWLAAHARWHHVVPDAVTLGLRAHVPVDGVDAETIRKRPGTMKELFAGRKIESSWVESYLRRTADLTSKADDLFQVLVGANFGIRREFHDLVGGSDESFTQWGMEDTEFGYRAYTRGALLVPVRDAFAWHQGPWEEGRAEKNQSRELQAAKCAHLIAHSGFRTGMTGRTFTVPQYVVTLRGDGVPAERLLEVVERVLAGPMHDLVVRVELAEGHTGREWLERQLGPDPRVRVAPARSALEEFPASPFHVTLPGGRRPHPDVVSMLRAELGTAVIGRSVFSDGSCASIARAWALHRALRTPWDASDFGEVVPIPPRKLEKTKGTPAARPATGRVQGRAWRARWEHLRTDWKQVDGPAAAWRFVRWVGTAVLRRVSRRFRTAPVPAIPVKASPSQAKYPLGAEIVALGIRSQAVFRASARVARSTAGRHVDVVVADTVAEAAGLEIPVVVLAEAPPLLSVPAFDPRADNPIGWRRDVGNEVAALGPLDRLPPDCKADRVVRRDDRAALQRIHHLEDVQAFHEDTVTRAGELVRLAASGVVVHLADGDRRLAPYLGAKLFELMTRDVRDLDIDGHEALSVRMRREALREHSLTSRARQVAERTLADPPRLPLVSILLATRRPELLGQALAAVRRQTYPRLELILGLHGEGFGEVPPGAAGPSVTVTALRPDAALPLGSVLNAATQAARGTLLTKMNDDDLYGPDHVWDLVLAQEYSRAPLVGKGNEFSRGGERYGTPSLLAGGTLLVARHVLDQVGGWARSRRAVDRILVQDIVNARAKVYRTHSYGYLLVRHGREHTWDNHDSYFPARADVAETGWRPERAAVSEVQPPFSNAAGIPAGRVTDYAALAAGMHNMLRRIDGNDNSGSADALRDLAEKLAATAPTDRHRAVATDLQDALSNGDLERALRMLGTAKRLPDLNAEKIVSRKFGFVWICIPKVASRSIAALLREIDPDAAVIRGKSISDVCAMHPEARSYYSFAFVRNPYYRAFSFYADKYLQPTDDKRRWLIEPYYGTSEAFSFDDLCRWLNTPYGSDAFADRHWLSQSRQVALDDGRLPDFVGHYENLDADFKAVCERLDMPGRALPRLNTRAGWRPTAEELQRAARLPDAYLSERNRALLRERYAADFTLLTCLAECA